MSVAQPTESPFDHDRYFTFTVNNETYNGSIHFLTHYAGKPDFVEVLRSAFFRDETYPFSLDTLTDEFAELNIAIAHV